MLFFPEFAPPTVEDLPKDVDETGGLVAREKAASDKVIMSFLYRGGVGNFKGEGGSSEGFVGGAPRDSVFRLHHGTILHGVVLGVDAISCKHPCVSLGQVVE